MIRYAVHTICAIHILYRIVYNITRMYPTVQKLRQIVFVADNSHSFKIPMKDPSHCSVNIGSGPWDRTELTDTRLVSLIGCAEMAKNLWRGAAPCDRTSWEGLKIDRKESYFELKMQILVDVQAS